MSRSQKKIPFFQKNLLKKTLNKKDYRTIKLWSRSSTILSEFVGYTFDIHNGKSFVERRPIYFFPFFSLCFTCSRVEANSPNL